MAMTLLAVVFPIQPKELSGVCVFVCCASLFENVLYHKASTKLKTIGLRDI
jgi:hypothetical protein